MKVKEKIVNILSIIFIVTLFLMSFTFIIFHNTDSATALKDAWSTLGSFFGGIATLTTAYVASLLFNDWREQEKITFIRNIAHETANLITQLNLSMQQYPKLNLSELKILHSKIITNLSFLNRQIKDEEMRIVNENFSDFMRDFYSIAAEGIDTPSLEVITKQKINDNIRTLETECNYISHLINIDKVYEKLKKHS
ncbi:hypothetical protein RFI02_02300 [Acinetobacter sichuanensis]|uniref:hypothetical protein n=1 Tax=Acinetobacter sichuanensis TaxID=2136183 RepID=UPI00280EACBF|nr:hypothetical protein [Acinetobacter sichuanensis]MDQ9019932.1 hypothetical protein [Acinetobacter sichuanensis]